jgi:hypothetical protein
VKSPRRFVPSGCARRVKLTVNAVSSWP